MELSDQELLEILYEIDQKSGNVSQWEASFIESNLERDQASFSPKQRDIIYKMMEKYLQ